MDLAKERLSHEEGTKCLPVLGDNNSVMHVLRGRDVVVKLLFEVDDWVKEVSEVVTLICTKR